MTSILGMVGGMVAGVGQLYAAEASAQQEDANAEVAKKDAEYARQAAQVDSQYIMEEGQSTRASARAIAAAQGAETTSGSPMIALMDMVAKERRAVIRRQYSGEIEATKYETESEFYKTRARNIRITGAISAVSTALSGPGVSYSDSGSRASGGYTGRSEGAYQTQRAGEREGYGSSGASSDYSDMSGWGDYL